MQNFRAAAATAASSPDRSPRTSASFINPLAHDARALAHSNYCVPDQDDHGAVTTYAEARHMAHAAMRAHVQDVAFPCVGAKSVFNRNRYRYGLYPSLGCIGAANGLLHDLYEFSHEFATPGDEFVSYVALFEPPAPTSEREFEQTLWRQLQQMHGIDAQHFNWDPTVSDDPADAEFSFSLGSRAFFIVGLHPQASRLARRTPCATLVFNLHEQFEALRQNGKYEPLQNAIRQRDIALQGSVNPVLKTFGESSEARQYSGRAIGDAWRCPFHHLHSS